MSSIPAGRRSWKCPECGVESLLSVAQLDPIACDACLAKMKSAGKSSGIAGVTDVVAGPMGLWSGLPEIVKLGAVVIALVAGLLIGFVAGKTIGSPPERSTDRPVHERSHSQDAAHTKDSPSVDSPTGGSVGDENEEVRPERPGPNYKWVRGRLGKDGKRGNGHWAKDPYYKAPDESSVK